MSEKKVIEIIGLSAEQKVVMDDLVRRLKAMGLLAKSEVKFVSEKPVLK